MKLELLGDEDLDIIGHGDVLIYVSFALTRDDIQSLGGFYLGMMRNFCKIFFNITEPPVCRISDFEITITCMKAISHEADLSSHWTQKSNSKN